MSEVFADADTHSVLAILDSHAGTVDGGEFHGTPGWQRHRLTLQVRETDEWKAWKARDGVMRGQQDFAEFIEDHVLDIVDPDGATMLELAQNFEATIGVEYVSAEVLSNSERKFVYKETVEGKAGRGGEIVIPAVIQLGIAPFEGVEPYKVEARFRYRIDRQTGVLTLGYKLTRPDKIEDDAFEQILEAVTTHVGQPVLHGQPGT